MEFSWGINFSDNCTDSEPVTTESELTIVPTLSSRPQTKPRINDATPADDEECDLSWRHPTKSPDPVLTPLICSKAL